MGYFRMADCNDGFTQCIFNRYQRIDGEVVCASHPSADFGLFLSQTQCKVFLFQTFFLLIAKYSSIIFTEANCCRNSSSESIQGNSCFL